MDASGLPRFAFLVHPLVGWHRRFIGARKLNLGLATGFRDGSRTEDVARLCNIELAGVARGVMMAIPMDPEQLLADQQRVLHRMERAVALAQEEGPLEAVGLGALCAVVAGRGEALGERLDIPVTTGAAATTWALSQNTQKIAEHQGGGPVAVVGSSGVVGHAVAASLVEAGLVVRVDSRRGARGLDVEVCAGPEEAVKTCTIVVGAGPTGGTLDGQALEPGSVVVDVAIPGTLRGRVPKGIQVLAGEAMSLPEGWTRGGWGHVFHLMAGYGPRQVFACLVEPLVLAAQGGTEPFSQGRRLEPGSVAKFGEAAREFGFHPRLARGWSRVDLGPDLG